MATQPRTRPDIVAEAPESALERDAVAAGRLPPRYGEPWFALFERRVRTAFRPGVTILDVGSGRHPTIGRDDRPADCTYVGLDASATELALAPGAAYSDTICTDVTVGQTALVGRFDLIVSWQVFEHIRPLPLTLELMRSYLRPGGRMIAQLSGGLSAFAVLGRIVPHQVSSRLMARLLGIPADETFPTHYDHCRFSALDAILSTWSTHEIVPRYKGSRYFRFSRAVEAGYLRYEDWICRHDWRELATHYLIDATR